MLIQKLYKSGNSIAITIPQEVLKSLNLKAGSEVVVKQRGPEFIITSKKHALTSSINHEFAKDVDEFIKTHQDVLMELAQK